MNGFQTGALALALSVCAGAAEHKETWQRTFPMSGTGERKLAVEIINGIFGGKAKYTEAIRELEEEIYRVA